MYKVTIRPPFDSYKRKNPKLVLYFDIIPTMKALCFAIDEELDGTKDELFRKRCRKTAISIGMPRLGSYLSNTVCTLDGILVLRQLKVYKGAM